LAILCDLGLVGRRILWIGLLVLLKLRDVPLLGANLSNIPIDVRFVSANIVPLLLGGALIASQVAQIMSLVGLIATQGCRISGDGVSPSARVACRSAFASRPISRLGRSEVLCLSVGVRFVVTQVLAIALFVAFVAAQLLSILLQVAFILSKVSLVATDCLAILSDLSLVGCRVLRVRLFVLFKSRNVSFFGANLADISIDVRFILANVVALQPGVSMFASQVA
jgi:hypothetical protein